MNIIIKHLPMNIITRITSVLNACLTNSYFPKAWKNDKIILLSKPGKDNTKADG
ncbi:hypothetical protein X975_08040, partial [Stegodyphus mimosarum]